MQLIKLLAAMVLSLTMASAHAAVTKVDFVFDGGNARFGVKGTFTYNSTTAGAIVDQTELLDFNFSIYDFFTPRLMRSFDLTNLDVSKFRFSYNTATNRFTAANNAQVWLDNGINGFEMSRGTARLSGLNQTYATTDQLFTSSTKYSVSAVPEPETYGLMLLGLGVIGAVARRRRQAQVY